MKKSRLLVLPALVLAASTLTVGAADAAHPVGGATYKPPASTGFGEAAVTLVVNPGATTVRGKAVDNCNLTYKITATRVTDSGKFKAVGKTEGGSKITITGKFATRNKAKGRYVSDACDIPEGTFTSTRAH